MDIRKSTFKDIPAMMRIYAAAKEYMVRSGNPDQWFGGYPSVELVTEDIEADISYICEENGKAVGCFVLIFGKDPTYGYIEDGEWLDDELPYATIHRIASDGSTPGVFKAATDFAFGQINNVRVDTHDLNTTMQHLAVKHGFKRCGIIYIDRDGRKEPRIAYQKIIR